MSRRKSATARPTRTGPARPGGSASAVASPCAAPAAVGASTRPAPRPSKAGRKRALVLLAVHVLIALHIAHWWTTGETISPLEPSEAMEFSKRGVVNAGFVFFALSLGSTLLLGRWMCGWACHLVALQDACRWLMLKVGVRPKAVQLGVLGLVPLAACLYMFVAPLIARALHGQAPAVYGTEFFRAGFWDTFPGLGVALLTFLVCGFAIVYFLGAKGFCAYGCPYGAAFGVLDQAAPWRIRVTDACEGCGHCTQVCSSNVKVSQEVRDWGMVVDPGCMKCMDCVSVCPKDALYFGPGRPALFARRGERARPRKPRPAGTGARVALAAAFSVAATGLFLWFNGDHEPVLWALLAAMTFGVAVAFRGRAERPQHYSLGEEIVLALAFLAGMAAFRGLYGAVPFLFSLGLSAVLAFLVLELWRLVRRSDLALHGHALKRGGRLTGSGVAFVGCALPLLAFWGHAGFVQAESRGAAARVEAEVAEARAAYNAGVDAAMQGELERAVGSFEHALELDPSFLEARENLAGALCALGRFEEGLEHFEASLAVRPEDAATRVLAARARLALGRFEAARADLESALAVQPDHPQAHALLAEVWQRLGDPARAAEHARRARGR